MQPTRAQQSLASVFFVVVGLLLSLGSWGVLSNIFKDDPDNATTNYLIVGLPFLAGGLILVVIGGVGLYSAWRASRSNVDLG
jgi:hypothetical protein